MRASLFVVVPLLLQLLIGMVFIGLRKPGGEFVGLGVMLMGLVAIPLTTLVNGLRLRRQPPIASRRLVAPTIVTTLVYPVLCLALYLLAS